jgi:hypothetical protein
MATSKGNKAKTRKSITSDKSETQAAVQPGLPGASQIPPNPQVIVGFHGLMAFTFNHGGFCEVGIHNQSDDHELVIIIFELSDNGMVPLYQHKVGHPSNLPVDFIRLDVKNPSVRGASFFMTNGAPHDDDQDFRLVPDLEGPDFYNRPLVKKPQTLRPRILIKHGVLFTGWTTASSFKRSAPFDDKDLGQIARLVAANIYFEADGNAALRIGNEEFIFNPFNDGRQYFVFISNSCHPEVCKYNPDSPIKEQRNDFYLYYKCFEIPAGQEEFELIRTRQALRSKTKRASPRANVFGFLEAALSSLGFNLSTDEAPCGGITFSQGNGIG